MVYNLRPNETGDLRFNLHMGWNSVLTQARGSQVLLTRYAQDTASFAGGTPATSLDTYGSFQLQPIYPNSADTAFAAWRPISLRAKIEFTGPTMYDGGSMVACRVTPPVVSDGIKKCSRGDLPVSIYRTAAPINDGILPQSAVTGPARKAYQVHLVPNEVDYEPIMTLANLQVSEGLNSTAAGAFGYLVSPAYSRSSQCQVS